jgi:hypothetical protein
VRPSGGLAAVVAAARELGIDAVVTVKRQWQHR